MSDLPPRAVADLLSGPPTVLSVGAPLFAEQIALQGHRAIHLDWRPPGDGDPRLAEALTRLDALSDSEGRPLVDAANAEAVARMARAQPVLVDIRPAGDALPDFSGRTLLHAGPPIAYERMCPPMRSAAQAGCVYEGWASDPAAADRLLANGQVALGPCHSRRAVGPMTGIVTPSMPVFVVENAAEPGNVAFSTVSEGTGKGLRFGGQSPEAIARLVWVRDVVAPALLAALRRLPDQRLPMRPVLAQALQMGDEMHMRNAASTALLVKALCGPLAEALNGQPILPELLRFLTQGNDQFFLNLIMASAKVIADAGRGVEGSSVVVCLARNGVEVGIQLSGLDGRWFTGPAAVAEGLYMPGYTPADANPDIGDSAIMEVAGLGGMALAAAPAIVRFLGRSGYREAQQFTETAYALTAGRNPDLPIPVRDFEGVPLGLDARRVVELGETPGISTAIAPRDPTLGVIIGAGIARPPLSAFQAAVLALAERLVSAPRP